MKFKLKGLLLTGMLVTMMSTAFAASDVLIEHHAADAAIGSDDFVTKAVTPDTKAAIEAFATRWGMEKQAIAVAKQHEQEKTLTDVDKAWLEVQKSQNKHSYSGQFDKNVISRVNFYKNSHNWNGENKDDKYYNYQMLPYNKDNQKVVNTNIHVLESGEVPTDAQLGKSADVLVKNQKEEVALHKDYTNSYGFNVLRRMADKMRVSMYDMEKSELTGEAFANEVTTRLTDIMEETQRMVKIDELRSYVNETVWFATKQTLKDKVNEEPEMTKKDRNLVKNSGF